MKKETISMGVINVKEIKNDNIKIIIIEYRGENDSILKIDEYILNNYNKDEYIEFVDINMDNPWIRILKIKIN